MNKICTITLLIFICTISCTQENFDSHINETDKVTESTTEKKSRANETRVSPTKEEFEDDLATKIQSILCNQVDKKELRVNKHYTLKSIQKNGNPLLYVINYDEGGWVIIAGNKMEEGQILAISETGNFNPDKITNPNVEFWFAMQLDRLERIVSEENVLEHKTGEDLSINSIPPFNDEYVWVRLPLEPQESTILISEVGHLLNTKWGQGYPWNYKCPSINGHQAPTGCVAVAVAQLLYYFHFSLGVPDGLYHEITPTFTLYDDYYTSNVTRSDYRTNSDRWSMMATSYNTRSQYTDYVGDLMIDIGERVRMKYWESSSGAAFEEYKNVFSEYGLSSEDVDYNSNKLIASLNANKPVLISSKRENNNKELEGHAWVIDGYKHYRTTKDTPYKWVTMPPDSLLFYNNLNYDYVLNLIDKERFYPDVYEGQIDHYYSYTDKYYLKMNWGYNGYYDNNNYGTGTYTWITDGNPFCEYTKMIYNFKPSL